MAGVPAVVDVPDVVGDPVFAVEPAIMKKFFLLNCVILSRGIRIQDPDPDSNLFFESYIRIRKFCIINNEILHK
jgi:hypothetical protein